jgi:DNA-directed RNA polymerase specialized sigma subunit
MTEDEANIIFLEEINKKLSILIKLNLKDRKMSMREKVKLLSDFDLSNKEISKILDISEIYVRKEKSSIKKLGKKKNEERNR